MGHTQDTVADALVRACERHGDRIAFSCLGAHLSYRRLERLSRRFAAFLHEHAGLRPGDRIALQLPNILQYPVAALGALRAGLVVVNTNPLYSPQELQHQLHDSGARALVVLANTAASAVEVVPRTAVELVITTRIGDLHGPLKGPLMNFVLRHVKKQEPALVFPRAVSFRRALARGRGVPARKLPAAPGELALLQYTGGTTGISRGAMLSHANLLANLHQLKERLRDECLDAGEVMVAPLPLYHIYAFTVHMLYGTHLGLHNLLIPNARDVPAMVGQLRGYTIAGMVGINTLFNALCGSSEFTRLDFSRLRISCAGGMALSPRTSRRWQELTGCRILEGYGLSEASPLVSCNCSARIQEGSIGIPVKDTLVKVVDEAGRELPVGEPGELCVKGPQVMSGYWRQPEASREVLDADGWLHTGDVAVIQADGFIRLVDRIKDLIIVSGYNVYPGEIEAFVCTHPAVREAAAVGVRRGDIGEKVKLYVVSSDPSLSRKEVIDYCSRGLASYKVPRLIEFRDSLPKSNVGKILRRKLRDSA